MARARNSCVSGDLGHYNVELSATSYCRVASHLWRRPSVAGPPRLAAVSAFASDILYGECCARSSSDAIVEVARPALLSGPATGLVGEMCVQCTPPSVLEFGMFGTCTC